MIRHLIAPCFFVVVASTAACSADSTAEDGNPARTTSRLSQDECDKNGISAQDCPGVVTTPPTSNGCFEVKLESSACLESDVWFSLGVGLCAAQGKAVNTYQVGAQCGNDKGFSGASIQCCTKEPPQPPTPPHPNECKRFPISPNDVKPNNAEDDCLKSGGTPSGIAQDPNGGAYLSCCYTPPPPQPPSVCGTIGFDQTCHGADELKSFVIQKCGQAGIQSFDLANECDKEGYAGAKYCCGDQTPPPPPPPPPSTTCEVMGDPTSCKPLSLWKEYAAAACKNGQLLDVSPGEACGNNQDEYRQVKYCCSN